MNQSLTGGPRRLWTGQIAAFACIVTSALVLAACSSSPSSSTTTTSTTQAASKKSTTGGTPASGGGSSSASRLAGLSSTLQSGEGTPFKATYSVTYSGQNETLSFEQSPPKFLFSIPSGEVIDTGTQTYFCSTASGSATCFSSTAEDPLQGLVNALSAKTAISSLQTAQAALAAKTAGYNASFSSQTFAGQPSTCVTFTGPNGTEKVCVTGKGQLAYVSSSPSQVFMLSSYSTNVSASDFSLPSGATVESIPSAP